MGRRRTQDRGGGAAAQNAPIRALSDLSALWKKDEAAVRLFLSETEAGEISRVTAERLRAEIDGKSAASEASVSEPNNLEASQADGLNVTPAGGVDVLNGSGQEGASDEVSVASSPCLPQSRIARASLALLVRHSGLLGRALLDQPASNSKSLLIRLNEDGRVVDVPLAEVELVEFLQE